MKASELRIGNWVKINDDHFEDGKEIVYDLYKTNEFQIMGFNDGSFIEGCKVICFYEIPSEIGGWVHSGCSDLDIDPIPLTEEWLLKFGFGRHHTDYANDIIYIKNVPDNTEFEWGVYPNELGSGIQIQNRNLLKYVHQLQNLYFALTGEEIEKVKEINL
jgi:hypothetical protein